MSAARTIVDLSARLSADRLGRLIDDGLRRGLVTVGGLDYELRRFWKYAPGRSPKTLEAALADRVPGYHGTKSDLEQDVFDAIVKGGLPLPVRQHKVVVNGEPYYIDMSNQLVGSTSRKKMAKVTVGKSKCEPVRRLRGAPLSHRCSRERCQVVAPPLAAVWCQITGSRTPPRPAP